MITLYITYTPSNNTTIVKQTVHSKYDDLYSYIVVDTLLGYVTASTITADRINYVISPEAWITRQPQTQLINWTTIVVSLNKSITRV